MSDGNEFAELLWDNNGPAMVHGGRRKQQPQMTAFPPFTCGGAGTSKAQEKQPGIGDLPAALLKHGGGGVYGAGNSSMAPSAHDFCSGLDASTTRGNGDLDDTVPWIHYPIIEDDDDGAAPALADSYSPDFFSELQAAAANLNSLPPPVHNAGANNRSATGPALASREPEPSKQSHHMSASVTTARPEPQQAVLPAAASKQPRLVGSGSEGLMNFSLFSRPAAMVRASLQQGAQRPPPPPPRPLTGADKPSNVTVVTASTRVESTVVQTSSGPARTAPVCANQQRTAWPQTQTTKEVRFACAAAPTTTGAGIMQQELPHQERVIGNNNMAPQRRAEARKAPEAAVAASSVCSGNGAGIGSDESWRRQMRKNQAECSASQDDDIEDESGGLRRSGSRGTKRSRTAEVHNLSERRRRDRINEKMRALQELIPNCNKIDKASMLDEAIEYLKTLQLQVQMMSMGTGLCIPPMMLPPTIQHMQIPPMAHFPHLGMGLGYGMGVFDMNSTTTVPLPPMPGAHFPCQMIPGAALQGLGIPGRNTLPMFGVPGQPMHPSVSGAQPFPSLANLPVRPNLAPQVSATAANMVQEQQQASNQQQQVTNQQQQVSNQQQQSLNDEGAQGASTGDPQLHTVLQIENQHFSMPSSTQSESSQFLDGGGNRTNSVVRNGDET